MTQTFTPHAGHMLLGTALEGGIGYWSRAYDIETVEHEGIPEYVSCTLLEYEDAWTMVSDEFWIDFDYLDSVMETSSQPPWMDKYIHTVTAEKLLLAFRRALACEPDAVQAIGMPRIVRWAVRTEEDPILPDLDAEDADVLVQYALFGKVVYG